LFQQLDVICYARRGPIGAESKEQGSGPWNFLVPLDKLGSPGTWT